MSAQRFGPVQKGITLVPLALLSTAWTASLAGVGATTASASDETGGSLPDGTSIPTQAIEDPASYTQPGSLGLGVRGSADQIVQASSTNGIPSAALAAYQRAASVINAADAACNIDWQLIAAIGRVESDHGRYGGNTLDQDGVAQPGIYGIALDGTRNTRAISDTDAGQYDNDTQWDRAVGPMQFIPSTWSVVGVDADSDGQRNPQDIDDAALASAVYLCSGNDDLSTLAGQQAAVHRYNNSQSYVDLVLAVREAYLSGDYTAVPNATTSAVYFQPDYNYTRPVLKPTKSDAKGSKGSQGGNGGSQPSNPPQEQPSDPPQEPVNPPSEPTDPGKTLDDTVKDVTEPVEDTVKDVVDTLSLQEALNLCTNEFETIDPLGLLNGYEDECAAKVEGKTQSDALATIPNTVDDVLAWLGA